MKERQSENGTILLPHQAPRPPLHKHRRPLDGLCHLLPVVALLAVALVPVCLWPFYLCAIEMQSSVHGSVMI
ncbi:hypothetical protein DUNSADRAFT_11436 [Dunaliella salina]|uniref:Uncharacterized protein n=1 Tax=Dunaliella salina TaxID=3046 RepID=A0ABQ7GDE2_DUNSA|nr:hypothetical protein DUNSADRAFT_11436 [Dunaliella salina]|eukprot:KAF5832619.1 hypothetical protein DUNSADRAFT_11436 [Dunaliella salina]